MEPFPYTHHSYRRKYPNKWLFDLISFKNFGLVKKAPLPALMAFSRFQLRYIVAANGSKISYFQKWRDLSHTSNNILWHIDEAYLPHSVDCNQMPIIVYTIINVHNIIHESTIKPVTYTSVCVKPSGLLRNAGLPRRIHNFSDVSAVTSIRVHIIIISLKEDSLVILQISRIEKLLHTARPNRFFTSLTSTLHFTRVNTITAKA